MDYRVAIIRRIGLSAILSYTLFITILRAVCFPNDFAEAQWLLDYRFGFVKRGFVGTIISLLTTFMHVPITEQLVTILSCVAFAVFCLVIITVGLRVVHLSGWTTGSVLAVLTFFSSPFIVMSAFLIGYYDNIIIILFVISIVLLLKGKIWIASWLQVISILVHENALLISFPVFCLAWLLVNGKIHKEGGTLLPFAPLLLPIGTFLVLIVSQSVFLPGDFAQSFASYLSNFKFVQNNRSTLAPKWITTTFFEYYSLQGGKFIGRLSSPSMFGLVLPSVLALLCFTLDAYSIQEISTESILLLVVCFVPQIMHMVAWDTSRIWTYSILCIFLSLWVYTEVLTERRVISSVVMFICLATLVLNIINITPFYDENEHFSLRTRLLLYTPVIGATLIMILCQDVLPIKERFYIRGLAISKLFSKAKDYSQPYKMSDSTSLQHLSKSKKEEKILRKESDG